MSKIQDALRKMQSGGGAAPDNRSSGKGHLGAPVARLAQQDAGNAELFEGHDDSRVVVVNRSLLRQAGLIAPEDQERYMADQYRIIKRPILDNVSSAIQGADGSPMNLIMVASSLPGDGKTFNCINLALSIATERDTSVLLVDADMPKPHISRLLGIENEPGLIDLLTDEKLATAEAIIRTDIPGLSVLPAGHINAHATELLASRRMARVVNELSVMQQSRIVIFDSPPILATAESRVLASRMGQILMIVRAGHTPQHAVLDALESLDHSKAINLVLNQATDGFGAEGYGMYAYGYGYGGHPASSGRD